MGLMLGKVQGDTIIVMDSFAVCQVCSVSDLDMFTQSDSRSG